MGRPGSVKADGNVVVDFDVDFDLDFDLDQVEVEV